MPLSRPSLEDLNRQLQADVTARIPSAVPRQRRSILGSILTATAGALHALYGFLIRFSLQLNPATATGSYLEGWASLWLGPNPRKPASTAGGEIAVTGTPGVTIPADTLLQSAEGVEYSVLVDLVLGAGGSGTATIAALQATADANQATGASLLFINPLLGVNAEAVVAASGLTGGANPEADEELRLRMIQRIRNPPHGGNRADYEGWALSVPGISQAWVFPTYAGPGTVRVYVANADYVGATLASAADVSRVASTIETVRPLGAVISNGMGGTTTGVTVLAPIRTPVAFSLGLSPDTPATRAAVTAALDALFVSRAAPEASIKLHHIMLAIGNASGVDDYTLTAPSADPSAGAGHILTRGAIAWL